MKRSSINERKLPVFVTLGLFILMFALGHSFPRLFRCPEFL